MDEKTPAASDNDNDLPPTDHHAVTPNPNSDMPATTASVGVATPQQQLNFLHDLSQEAIYLMGLSFILGSLFTIFILLIFDFMRRNSDPTK